ncbi:hypothetical protein SDC9_189148 [bioreactor metagenome]|uniref:Uncharacterized protein n=1 Tax=bioreactor metagenome TaxID=1076179 RepID=A0A645HZL6_9ZZZZ
MDFMPTDGEHVHTKRRNRKRNFAEALYRVGMKQGMGRFYPQFFSNLGYWLYGAHFIIDQHHRNKNGLLIAGIQQLVRTDAAVGFGLHFNDLKATAGKFPCRCQH